MGEAKLIDPRRVMTAMAGLAVLVGLYFASLYNYLLFHVLAEGFSIAIACGIFMIAWNSRRFLDNNYFFLLGMAFLFIGALDLVHTMAYKGTNIFPGYDANLPTQLWLSARFLQGATLLIAPLLIGRAIWEKEVLMLYAAMFVLLLGLIFSGHFPAAYVEGQGLTLFKKISEYVIALLLVGAIFTLRSRKNSFDAKVLTRLYVAIAISIASELAFTLYSSVSGFPNLVGHYLKLVAFVLIYRAVIVTGLREPYRVLFRDLKMREEQLQAMFDNLPVGIAYIDANYRFTSVNRFLCEMAGINEEDIIGKHCYDTIGEEADDPVTAGIGKVCSFCKKDECFTTKRPTVIERPLGDKVIRVTTIPQLDVRGRIAHCLEMVEDITTQKVAEDIMHGHRLQLEELVKERTAKLVAANEELEQQIAGREKAESQLVQSRKMEAVGQLAGGVAHDFNNRLFAIRNYAFILKSVLSDGEGADTVEKLIASCDKAAKLVDDLLRFSRKKAINPKPVDANAIIREARNILDMAAGKDTELVVDLSKEPLQVMADVSNMELVLLNLVNNARDVMEGHGRITISTELVGAGAAPVAEYDGGQSCPCALIKVSDTGPGLSDDAKGKIFEPFYTTKAVGKGTGLGLSIVYGTVKQHGGFIDVESIPGRGTTFRIYLPMLK